MTEREFAISVVRTLRQAGHEALWAGGCVRDELLGLTPADYDVATSARPEQVRPLFRRTIEVGVSFGVVEVVGPRGTHGRPLRVQVATFRSDGAYSDGRRPDQVVFSNAREDALRRDFTINGMFFDPLENRLIDYVGGQADLRAGILRAIGQPLERFKEDKLRLLRAIRLATRFSFRFDPETYAAIKALASEIRVVSAERIADELRKLLMHPRRSTGMRLLAELGLLEPIFPELLPLIGSPEQASGFSQSSDRWKFTLRVLDHLGEAVSFPLALAALLREVEPAGQERLAARVAGQIAQRLRLSNAERERVEWLVLHQRALTTATDLKPHVWKRLFVHPGIEELIRLHRAAAEAAQTGRSQVEYCERLLQETPREELDPPMLLTGNDLQAIGLRPGPQFRLLLNRLRDAQLDGEITTREQAIVWLQQTLATSGEGV